MAVERTSTEPEQPRSFDLRERRRTRTRLMIQTEAYRLFSEKGYANTTVEDIADAAEISPRTFFRYFPTKEDVVIWDEYDPLALELLEARPDDEPLVETFRAIIRETLGGLYRHDPEQLLARLTLSATVPEIRARIRDAGTHGIEELAPLLARKTRARPDELQLRVVGSAMLAAVFVALDIWQEDGGKGDLLALFDRAIDALAESMSGLPSSVGGRDAPAKRRASRR